MLTPLPSCRNKDKAKRLLTELSTAIEIARAAHEGQVNKAGIKSIKYEIVYDEYEDWLKSSD